MDWVQVGIVTNVFAGANAFVGLAVTAHDSVLVTTARVDSVIVTLPSTAPALESIPDQIVAEGAAFSLTVTATDADLPTNTLTFGLIDHPDGMTIDPASGVITWTPTEAQGPSKNPVTVVVTDNGSPVLGATNTFTVVVTNNPPVLAAIALTNGEVVLGWNAVTGRTNRLEWNPDPTAAAGWTNSLGDFLSTNTMPTVTDAVTNGAQRFYRVRRLS